MYRFLVALLLLAIVAPARAADASPAKPNVLVIYIDDMGWAQPGCYGGKLAPTPHIDAIAAGGVRFTNGYVSACVCSPSRVGLITGRYQQRRGHDANSTAGPDRSLDIRETTFAQRMKDAGYVTGIFGKWHLGEEPEYLPASRGFDESFGTLANLGEGKPPHFYRGKEAIADPPEAPVTSPLFRDASIAFMEKHRGHPWFLYLPFNDVHAPNVASEESLNRFAHLTNPREQAYAAQISEVDAAIGRVLAKLRDLKLEKNTLVFCISDNGGASSLAEMGGLRGRKWLVWEGGIRVTWLAQWEGHIPAGQVCDEPVIQLDVLPTALAAAGVSVKPEWQLDGLNLLPLLTGAVKHLDREALYWRFGVQYAVRQGDWKLVKAGVDLPPMLVNLANDPGEQVDLSQKESVKAAALQALWDRWNSKMEPPRWVDRRWNGEESRKAGKENKKKRKKEQKGKQAAT